MPRWLTELFNPASKCGRVGHAMRFTRSAAYTYPSTSHWSAVADWVELEKATCCRCGHAEPEVVIDRLPLTGLTLDRDRWGTLRKEGRLDI